MPSIMACCWPKGAGDTPPPGVFTIAAACRAAVPRPPPAGVFTIARACRAASPRPGGAAAVGGKGLLTAWARRRPPSLIAFAMFFPKSLSRSAMPRPAEASATACVLPRPRSPATDVKWPGTSSSSLVAADGVCGGGSAFGVPVCTALAPWSLAKGSTYRRRTSRRQLSGMSRKGTPPSSGGSSSPVSRSNVLPAAHLAAEIATWGRTYEAHSWP